MTWDATGKITLQTGAAVAAHRLVKLDGGDVVHNTAASDDDPIGATEYLQDAGQAVMARLLNDAGSFMLVAAGAIATGADVFAAADGKIQALPAAVGTYRRVGKALESASIDGDEIRVMPYGYTDTVTVS